MTRRLLKRRKKKGDEFRRIGRERAKAKAIEAEARKSTMPAASWWTGLDRKEFAEACERERPRMARSPEGRVKENTITAGRPPLSGGVLL